MAHRPVSGSMEVVVPPSRPAEANNYSRAVSRATSLQRVAGALRSPNRNRPRHHFGQSTDRSAAVQASRWREVDTAASFFLNNSHFCFPSGRTFLDSRAVRALSEVTVLCPFLHERFRLWQGGDRSVGGPFPSTPEQWR